RAGGRVRGAAAMRPAAKLVRGAPPGRLAGLSQEFRTPLNVIMGYATLLREWTADALDARRDALDRVQANSTSLLHYVETLFYLSELDHGMSPLAVGDVRVATVLG